MAGVAVFMVFVTWGESPASWEPVDRFVVGFMAILLGIGVAGVTNSNLEDHYD